MADETIKKIEGAIERFNKSIPSVQSSLLDEISALTKELDLKRGNIVTSATNVKLIAQIKARIEKLILSPEYKENVKQFAKTFSEVSELQNKYFSELSNKYAPPKVLAAIRQESVNSAIESLTESGLRSSLVEPIREILRVNITGGAKYTDLTKSLRNFLTNSPSGDGALLRYTKQIVTDSLNTYSRSNLNAVTNDLGLEWFNYSGAIIETSRPFCKALHAKKYFHKSEIPKLLKGDFQEFRAIEGKINPKTKLPYGMIEGTNEQTFLNLAGGHSCNHIPTPVDELAVPKYLREQFS